MLFLESHKMQCFILKNFQEFAEPQKLTKNINFVVVVITVDTVFKFIIIFLTRTLVQIRKLTHLTAEPADCTIKGC